MNTRTARVLAEIRALIDADEQVSDGPAMAAFAEVYLDGVPASLVAARRAERLYDAVKTHYALLAQPRTTGTPLTQIVDIDDAASGCDTALISVAEDMAFLVDTVTMAVRATGAEIDWIVHPVVQSRRDGGGEFADVAAYDDHGEDSARSPESLIRVEFAAPAGLDRAALCEEVRTRLIDVHTVVGDWRAMRRRLQQVIDDLDQAASGIDREEREETQAFLSWLADDHFTFLGYRSRAIQADDDGETMVDLADTSLGLLREDRAAVDPDGYVAPAAVLDEYTQSPRLAVVTKANRHAWIHHPETMDVIAIKRLDAAGNVIGAHRFLGLFSGEAYRASPRDIPLLRRKISHVMARAAFRPRSHAAKSLRYILETFPRDELFQASEAELFETVTDVLNMRETERLRLFLRRDRYRRFYSAIVYIPRERYTVALRQQIEATLGAELAGQCQDADADFLRGSVVRLVFQIATDADGATPATADIERRLVDQTRAWPDRFLAAAREVGTSMPAYAHAFEAAYQRRNGAEAAVADAAILSVRPDEAAPILRVAHAAGDRVTLKLYGSGEAPALSDVVPIFEYFGLAVVNQHPFVVERGGFAPQWIHEFEARHPAAERLAEAERREALAALFDDIMAGRAANDNLNRLVVEAGFSPREIVLVRAVARYLLQTELPFSPVYIGDRLAEQAELVGRIIGLFGLRLDPDRARSAEAESASVDAIEAALEAIASLDTDRVLRAFYGVVDAVLRTNYYQRDETGQPKPYVSLKLDSSHLAELPEPRPWVETFVYAPEVEGVHLRGGPIARGGLRWSDRLEDFRTEVLGLMKAQMVKNAVIVPVGAKGGFVLKNLPADIDRETRAARGIAGYKVFIRGLLDITDNRVGDEIVTPPGVLARDAADPYLVVAADKGTATFSDIANGLSGEYHFWLDDAFASGGSAGYDHKAMGITARGAWEGVKRHFREMGRDCQTEAFSAVAVGDMGGDVFGNGMLASRTLRLQAAFNHRHIFIDPNPDAEASYAERERLFKAEASGWDAYDPELISRGGGVYERSAKRISVSDEAMSALGLAQREYTPTALIAALLAAPVDLFWNGGIGTYVKASHESHADVGDRANDALRIDGRNMQARVVGEGGNLGFTQAGRIEYALAGGRINTDAIDNSGGVDSSDLEVNIKIALGTAEAAGRIDRDARNRLLADMTPEVIDLVLRTNVLQTQQISLMQAESTTRFDEQVSFMRALERDGRLDRRLEGLPDDETIEMRARERAGLTRPELAVLISYNKLALADAALAGGLADDPALEGWLFDGLPAALGQRFGDDVRGHRLRRELIATLVTNQMVDRLGIASAHRLPAGFGTRMEAAVRGYVLADAWLGGESLFEAVDAQTGALAAEAQYRAHRIAIAFLKHAMNWWLATPGLGEDISALLARYQPGATALVAELPDYLTGAYRERFEATEQAWTEQGMTPDLARRIAVADVGGGIMDIAALAAERDVAVTEVAALYYRLGDLLGVPWLQNAIHNLPANERWQALARMSLRGDSYRIHQRIVDQVLTRTVDDPLADWQADNERTLAFISARLGELQAIEAPGHEHLTVVVRDLARLTLPGQTSLGGAA